MRFLCGWSKLCKCNRTCLHLQNNFDIVNMENIYTTAKPFYILAKVLGLFSKSLVGPEIKGIFETKWHGIFTSFLSGSTAIALLSLNLLIDDGPTSSSEILSKLLKLQAIFGIVLIIVQFVYQHSKNHAIVEVLHAFHRFDQKVHFFLILTDSTVFSIQGKTSAHFCWLP